MAGYESAKETLRVWNLEGNRELIRTAPREEKVKKVILTKDNVERVKSTYRFCLWR